MGLKVKDDTQRLRCDLISIISVHFSILESELLTEHSTKFQVTAKINS